MASIILFVGVFTPIVSFPIIGYMNYLQNGRGDGVIVLILAVISLVLVWARYQHSCLQPPNNSQMAHQSNKMT